MGCNNSKVASSYTAPVAEEPQPPPTDSRLPLTAREVFRLQKSWKGIKRKMEETGTELFVGLLTKHSDVKPLFKHLSHLDSAEQMRMDETLIAHGAMVLSTIDDIITHIDDVDRVIDMCNAIRQRHLGYAGFIANLFWLVEEPFLQALRINLDNAFTEQMEEIYRKTLRFMVQTLSDSSDPGSITVPHVVNVNGA